MTNQDVREYLVHLYSQTYGRRYHAFRFQLALHETIKAYQYHHPKWYRKVSKIEFRSTPLRSHGPLIDLCDYAACDLHPYHLYDEGRYQDFYILRNVTNHRMSYKAQTLPTCISLKCPVCYAKYRANTWFVEKPPEHTITAGQL